MRAFSLSTAVSGSLIGGALLTSCTQLYEAEPSHGVEANALSLTHTDATTLCAPYPGKRIIIGTDRNDVIDGTNKAECIVAGRGNDRISAGGGDDVIFAGDGDDIVQGNDGQDKIFGGAGNDRLYGGDGADELHGENGADLLDGQSGADRSFGENCHDRIAVSFGDSVDGGSGTDTCQGNGCERSAYSPVCRCQGDCGSGMRCVTSSGVCVAASAERCEFAQSGSSCVPTASTDATCNGVDDDCSGTIDEDYVRQSVSCGVGACARSQLTSCVAGVIVSQCSPGSPAPNDNTCNGLDDNCNGQTDEGYAATITHCGVGQCAADGHTSCVHGAVTNTCTPGIAAANDSTCNGIDDDCDGTRDEDYLTQVVSCGTGACAAQGTRSCSNGAALTSCTPGSAASHDAVCNGIDDDCDGHTDEEFVTAATSCGVGACGSHGSTSCINGVAADSCTPGVGSPSDATCDAKDDDCDGRTDEAYLAAATQCGVGECRRNGSTQCEHGVVQSVCTPGAPASNDATCNGADDDCDGRSDEGYLPQVVACGAGACAANGTSSCSDGNETASCTPGTASTSDTVCNGIDDDCDGEVDEDFQPSETSCGSGACSASGHTSCVTGAVEDSCHAGAPSPHDDACNGVDDDCNGAVDEDFHAQATSCGVGACASSGVTSCAQGTIVDSCTAAPAAANDASCNGIDDDCDRNTDEDFVAETISCGVGACAAHGTTSCVQGQLVSSCTPATTSANDTVCNGIDDDCDGHTDEEFVAAASSCGVGACAASGTLSCPAGHPIDDCVPGAASQSDASCDGIDDDCDGHTDEDYVCHATSCGIGACAGSGTSSCVLGVQVDTCVVRTPTTPVDASCNASDDDCDGHVDEDFVGQATECGVGACAACGQTSCQNGCVVDSCTPGPAAHDDATCDGIDDDCGGDADEDFTSAATSCGVGACTATGALLCSVGHVTNSCTPLAPNGDDHDCNGIDNNCNGQIDEHAEIDDSNACTADSCDPVLGVAHQPLPEGTNCGAGTICDGASHCRQGVALPNFANLTTVQLNGSAVTLDSTPVVFGGSTVLRMTNDANQSSSALLKSSVSLQAAAIPRSFSAHFSFQMTNSGGLADGDGPGGDGLAFIIATSSTAGGTFGGGIGYQGVTPSVIVEFDTFDNGPADSLNGNHIGLNLNGNAASIALVPVSTRFNNDQVWQVSIDYNATTHQLEVRAAPSSTRPSAPTLSRTLDVRAQLGVDNAFVGFTSGTGSASNTTDVRNLVWTSF